MQEPSEISTKGSPPNVQFFTFGFRALTVRVLVQQLNLQTKSHPRVALSTTRPDYFFLVPVGCFGATAGAAFFCEEVAVLTAIMRLKKLSCPSAARRASATTPNSAAFMG